MKLNYNKTGTDRKRLVAAISQELNKPLKYLGAPTFAYEIGDYTIDKNGALTGPDSLDLEDALHRAGFDADERKYDEPDTYESGLGGLGAVEILDFEDLQMDGNEEMGLGKTRRKDYQGENGMQASDVPEPDILTIELPLTNFTVRQINNLQRLVASKANILEKAFKTKEIAVDFTEDEVLFPWFEITSNADEVKAYTHFIAKLCEYAKGKETKDIKPKTVENYKYAMRTFLLRLGFIGAEYKEMRKILLKNLSGSSAYRNGGGHHE